MGSLICPPWHFKTSGPTVPLKSQSLAAAFSWPAGPIGRLPEGGESQDTTTKRAAS